MLEKFRLFAIDSNYYFAGIIVKGENIVKTAPIVKWSLGKSWSGIKVQLQQKGFKIYESDSWYDHS